MKSASKSVFALVAVAVTIGIVWHSHQVVPAKEATWDDVRAEARQAGYRLITTDGVLRQYNQRSESLLLVDTRQEWEYRTGHINGALNFPMEPTWLSRWRNKGSLEKFLGPDKNRLIVFY
jgi:hypothetical protein